MSGFLLDTNVPSELTRDRPEARVQSWLDDADDGQLYFSVISIGEIRKGLRLLPDGRRRSGLVEWVDGVLIPWFGVRILPVTQPIAERWGDLTGNAQLRGLTISMADGLIAATAAHHRLTVVTRNTKDFVSLGVPVFNPWLAS